MPKIILSPEEEEAALWAGYDVPVKTTYAHVHNVNKITDSMSPRPTDGVSEHEADNTCIYG